MWGCTLLTAVTTSIYLHRNKEEVEGGERGKRQGSQGEGKGRREKERKRMRLEGEQDYLGWQKW